MSTFNPDGPLPRWRVGIFVSSADPRRHILLLACDDEIEEYGRHKDFVAWVDQSPLLDVIQQQHAALDSLLAELIILKGREFRPTQHKQWPAIVAGADALRRAGRL
jgi:hypothetical protein